MDDRGARSVVTLHRFFLPSEAVSGTVVTFPPESARQIERVLRLKPGDRVVALDGSGREHVVLLDTVGRGAVGSIECTRPNEAEPVTRLTLYLGLLKGAKFELVLQKCTEVGVSCFVPVATARAVRAEPSVTRQTRFVAIVREAAEQSGRGLVPQVGEPAPLRDALLHACATGPTVLLWEDERNRRMKDLELPAESGSANLFVGPEGGFTAEEVESARRAGAQIVMLGRRILRSETAAIVGAALLLERCGEYR